MHYALALDLVSSPPLKVLDQEWEATTVLDTELIIGSGIHRFRSKFETEHYIMPFVKDQVKGIEMTKEPTDGPLHADRNDRRTSCL